MGFFKRLLGSSGDERTNVPEPEPEPEPAEDPLEGISLDPQSVDDAKLTIKELRLRKKDLQARKRDVATDMADQREAWRETQAGRYSTTGMGRGTGARIIRAGIQGKRRSERLQHASTINLMNDAKQEIDVLIVHVDRAILEMERYVLRGKGPER